MLNISLLENVFPWHGAGVQRPLAECPDCPRQETQKRIAPKCGFGSPVLHVAPSAALALLCIRRLSHQSLHLSQISAFPCALAPSPSPSPLFTALPSSLDSVQTCAWMDGCPCHTHLPRLSWPLRLVFRSNCTGAMNPPQDTALTGHDDTSDTQFAGERILFFSVVTWGEGQEVLPVLIDLIT